MEQKCENLGRDACWKENVKEIVRGKKSCTLGIYYILLIVLLLRRHMGHVYTPRIEECVGCFALVDVEGLPSQPSLERDRAMSSH